MTTSTTSAPAGDVLARVCDALPRFAYSFGSEAELHRGLFVALQYAGVPYEHEAVRGADRFDFLCDDGVVIEAKVQGSFSAAMRQVDRYLKRDDVTAAVIVTTRRWGVMRSLAPNAELRGKPVRMIHLQAQAF